MSSLPISSNAVMTRSDFCIGLAKPLDHLSRHHLPGQTVLVLEPATNLGLGITTGGELVPEVIELLLVLDIDLQRDGLVELEDAVRR